MEGFLEVNIFSLFRKEKVLDDKLVLGNLYFKTGELKKAYSCFAVVCKSKDVKQKEKALDGIMDVGRAFIEKFMFVDACNCFDFIYRNSEQKEKALDGMLSLSYSCIEVGYLKEAYNYFHNVYKKSESKEQKEKALDGIMDVGRYYRKAGKDNNRAFLKKAEVCFDFVCDHSEKEGQKAELDKLKKIQNNPKRPKKSNRTKSDKKLEV